MKRYLCPQHIHYLKVAGKTIQLDSKNCTICRWESRPSTLIDIATRLENVAIDMRTAYNDPYYDPHGITFHRQFEEIIIDYMKSINPEYIKNFLKDNK